MRNFKLTTPVARYLCEDSWRGWDVEGWAESCCLCGDHGWYEGEEDVEDEVEWHDGLRRWMLVEVFGVSSGAVERRLSKREVGKRLFMFGQLCTSHEVKEI